MAVIQVDSRHRKEDKGIKIGRNANPDQELDLSEEWERLAIKYGSQKDQDGNAGKLWVEICFGSARSRGIEKWYNEHPEFPLDPQSEEDPLPAKRKPGRPARVRDDSLAA